jgi:hypothetical protein
MNTKDPHLKNKRELQAALGQIKKDFKAAYTDLLSDDTNPDADKAFDAGTSVPAPFVMDFLLQVRRLPEDRLRNIANWAEEEVWEEDLYILLEDGQDIGDLSNFILSVGMKQRSIAGKTYSIALNPALVTSASSGGSNNAT